MERKQQKQCTQDTMSASKPSKNQEKSLEEFLLDFTKSSNPAHKLEVKLVRADMNSEEFQKTFKASHRLYQKYQVAIHNDPPDKVNERQVQFIYLFVSTRLLSVRLLSVTFKTFFYEQ